MNSLGNAFILFMLQECKKPPKKRKTERTQRKCIFIESSPLMIPTTLGIKAPVWVRTPMDHLQTPSDFGSCHLACGSPCWQRAALASPLHLWADSLQLLPPASPASPGGRGGPVLTSLPGLPTPSHSTELPSGLFSLPFTACLSSHQEHTSF